MKKIFKLLKRAVVGILVLLSILLIIGFVFERISRSKEDKMAPIGRLIDVGTSKHLISKTSTIK